MKNMDSGVLLDTALEHLRGAGLGVRLVPRAGEASDAGFDATVELGWGERREVFHVDVKRALRPSTAGPVLQRLAGQPQTLLVADRIAGGLAELARESGVSYADATGNAWIRSPEFLVDIQGKSQPAPTAQGQPAALTKTDLRVVLALIALVAAGMGAGVTARRLADAAGVSHGAAGITMRKLRELGHLSPQGVRRGAQLLDRWTEGYLARGGAHKTSRTLYVAGELRVDRALADVPGVVIGGELAGELMGWPIRPASALVYAPQFYDVARHLRGSSTGDGIPVEVRTPAFTFGAAPAAVAKAMLARADMLMSADPRQIEVAQEVVDRDENLRHLREIA